MDKPAKSPRNLSDQHDFLRCFDGNVALGTDLSHSSREHQVLSPRLRLISKIEQELLLCIIPLDDVEMDETGKEGDDFVAREL